MAHFLWDLDKKRKPLSRSSILECNSCPEIGFAPRCSVQHISEVWNESDKPTPEAIAHTLTAAFPFSENPQTCSPPDIATFTKALLDARGAAGCDGWSSMETQYIPIQAVQQLYRLTERWYRAAAVPRAFECGRQVNLHKPSKIKNFQLDAAHTRPITVYSIFWRAYASAWMRTPAFQHFAQSLPEEIVGVYQHEGSEEAATALQQKLALKQGVLVSLDYSQCYDRMNIHATFDFLESIRWPQPLIQQLRQVWQTKRLLEYDGQVHPEILVSSGVPQGCPIAPLTLATWMSSGSCAVQQLMQSEASYTEAEASQATTRIYMDDRSWVDADFDRALQRANQWHRWSASVGLKESREKIQACAKPQRIHDQLPMAQPDWSIPDQVKVLGVSVQPKMCANTELETDRLKAALKRAQLLSCLPVPHHRKLEIYKMFVIPKALYGWIIRFPTKADSNKVFNSLSKMTGSNYVANPLIRSTIYGGACHMQVLLATRLFKRLCRMRSRGTAIWTNIPGTPAKALRSWLKDLGWQEQTQWTWKRDDITLHAPLHTEVTAQCHHIRMSWRETLLRKWAGGKRHETQEWRRLTSPLQMRAEIQNLDLEAARKSFMKSDAPAHAIILGSTVSPAWMGREHADGDPRCPWCNRLGNFLHIAWHCSQIPKAKDRPPKPTSWLLSRFAWPQNNTPANVHQQVLNWLAHIQELIWFSRYGPARANHQPR